MFEKRRSATGWLGCQGLLLAMVLLLLLSALSGCGSGQSDVGQTNGNSVPVNLNISMPQESAAASTSGSRFWAKLQSWLPSVTSAWAATTADLRALTVEVTGPGLDPPITSREELPDPRSGQTVTFTLDVPVGPNRVFTVSGLNGSGRAILQGQSTPIVLTPGQPTTVDITLVDITITITTPSLPSGTVGVAYSEPVQATGGTGALTWTINAGTLPPPLTINSSTGVISGTPSTAGTFNFTVRATDTTSLFDTQPLSITIARSPIPPNITTTTLPGGTVNAAYSQPVRATGGTGALTWTISAGALPPPLTINSSTGVISGTPSTAGTFEFMVRATDTLALFDTQALSIAVVLPAPPTITTTTLPNGTVRTAYTQSLQATGGTGTRIWSLSSGSLPTNLSLSPAGVISGTPTNTGTANFTVRVTDALSQSDNQALSITIVPAPIAPTITTTSLPGGTVDAAYSEQVRATGGTGALTWTVSAGSLPPPLTLNPTTGVISGIPSTAGTFNFTVRATDTLLLFDTQSLSIIINAPPLALTITTTTLLTATVTHDYRARLAASGGTPPYTWSIDCQSSCPPPASGLSLSSSGAITGTPTTAGTFLETYRVRDSIGATVTKDLTINVNRPPIAAAGRDSSGSFGNTFTMNGSESFDPDEDPLTYHWDFTAVPYGCEVPVLSNSTTATPSFTTSCLEDYILRLIVNDGHVDSAPDLVIFNVFAIG